MNILKEEGIIKDWRMDRQDASIYDDTPPLFEKIIKVTPVEGDRLVDVGNEIYGPCAMLYFYCNNASTAKTIADILRRNGGTPSFQWSPDNDNLFDMQVSYFKGCRWWE